MECGYTLKEKTIIGMIVTKNEAEEIKTRAKLLKISASDYLRGKVGYNPNKVKYGQ